MRPPRRPSAPIKRAVIERLLNYFKPVPANSPADSEAPTLVERPAALFPPPRPIPNNLLPPRDAYPNDAPMNDPTAPPLYPLNTERRRDNP